MIARLKTAAAVGVDMVWLVGTCAYAVPTIIRAARGAAGPRS